MATIEAIYQEIAGTAPDREAVARINRAGRLLNLTQTDSGWVLLAVLAAHGSLAQAELQSAATLAASLSVAANEAKTTTEAITRATKTATAAITEAVGGARPTLTGAVDDAARQAATRLETFYQDLWQKIEDLGIRTTGTLAGGTDRVVEFIEGAITTAAGDANSEIRKAVDTAIGEAVKKIGEAGGDLSSGAQNAREGTINEWRIAVVAEVGKELTSRSLIDMKAARRRTIRAAALACGLIAVLVAGIGYGAHRIGWQDGRRYGIGKTLTQFHDQKARASWANTPDGRLAYQLYQGGFIRELATCSGQGWKIKFTGGYQLCLPYSAKNGSTYGWFLK